MPMSRDADKETVWITYEIHEEPKSAAPRNHLIPTDFEPPRNLVIANPVSGEENDAGAPHAPRIQRLRSHPALQIDSLFITHD